MTSSEHTCSYCQKVLPSKNALFKHLRKVAYHSDDADVIRLSQPEDKVAVLYGYSPYPFQSISTEGEEKEQSNNGIVHKNDLNSNSLLEGHVAAKLVMKAIMDVEQDLRIRAKLNLENGDENNCDSGNVMAMIHQPAQQEKISALINRTFGSSSRNNEALSQDIGTGALSEVLCAKVSPLIVDTGEITKTNDEIEKEEKLAIQAWLKEVNAKIMSILERQGLSCQDRLPRLKVFGRLKVPNKFNAETDVTSRKVSYILPLDFFVSSNNLSITLQDLTRNMVCFNGGNASSCGITNALKENVTFDGADEITQKWILFMFRLKKVMQRFMTIAEELDPSDKSAVLEKEHNSHKIKRNKLKNRGKNRRLNNSSNQNVNDEDEQKVEDDANKEEGGCQSKKRKEHVLRRKRYHNFSPSLMAHEFLAFRRVDRFYHKSTKKRTSPQDHNISRLFLEFSVMGDLFLCGQVQRMIGLFLAVARGLIDEDILECIFDEEYANLIPTPPAPAHGLYSDSSQYMTWEGKLKRIMSPRVAKRYSQGWCESFVIESVTEFQNMLEHDIYNAWFKDGVDESGRLVTEKKWCEEVLEPWSCSAKLELKRWREWKAATKDHLLSETNSLLAARLLPPLESIDKSVPNLYSRVLFFLREADKSGLWPTTTPKRKLVMVSQDDDASLAFAHVKAKSNKVERVSAYSYTEGQGGASGSFSIGAMPGDQCSQPKGNELFPELMKAAFELEIALCPNRNPSSTIAVNRNAQFRPHTDSGAGAGQSTSLIVGLGDYVGGELMVEGEQNNIRYNPVEFNGWKQRHWTLPFLGERFSLVWFTPVGCEGVRGIDICK